MPLQELQTGTEQPQRSLMHYLQRELQLPPEVQLPTYEDILRDNSLEDDIWGNLTGSMIN